MDDDGDRVLFFCAVVLLLLQSILLAFLFFYLLRRSRKEEAGTSVVELNPEESQKKAHGKPPAATPVEAWADVEKGESPNSVSSPPAQPKIKDSEVPIKLPLAVRRELCESLRGLLEEEISRGLERSGINDRLDRLEKQVHESGTLTAEATGTNKTLRSTATATAGGEDVQYLDSSSSSPATPSRVAPASPSILVSSKEDACEPPPAPLLESDIEAAERTMELAPSRSQMMQEMLTDTSTTSKARRSMDEESSLRGSLVTVQRALGRRDAETQELKRQLRETSQALWNQTVEARHATKRLQDLLSDPTSAPALQADELARALERNEELSAALADAKSQEGHWETVARRQRAFFLQSQHVSQDNIKRHPAGEVFIVPPPVCLQEDEDFNRIYDIGTQHLNPYVTDSWPFEPNAQAQRTNMEQTMPNLDEEDEIESGSEEESPREDEDSGDRDASPRLRMEAGLDVPIEPPEPIDGSPPAPVGRPPHHPSDSARSY
mmetsp:Transcript_46569/g.110756  ORF Transcript_46569/g.110756 Transcript_46569/m.110756 type:complete len:494 (+) Transcript_46569:198-1679(+)|eukprot:CAMPEP_0178409888 /NCGR_PEP_ID=MMETSP0689_2-20121128/20694_1 /TAXON_ID=160604 /ORGANISM="Amphidinium massartii, Strain CS-259" /LENGTH=493 /DNA_ID=CAMNT_0020031043 /DNA_START=120 /DNA_END=1601 /DNA_ORIENTATION=+